jgi:hypothetical protein
MKGGLLALAILFTACSVQIDAGPGSTASGGRVSSPARTASGPRTPPCNPEPPTVTAPLNTAGVLPAGPSTAPAAALGVMFGGSLVDKQSYVVDLVDTTGNIVATAKAHLRSPIKGTCGNDVQVFPAMPLISTSRGRVYYLDGDTDVRFLAPDGSTGLAARLPGSSQSASIFAVSTDDRRIAVAVFDYRAHPITSRLYVEDLGGGHRVNLDRPGALYPWPVGWHASTLIVASDGTASPSFGFYAPLPYRISSVQLIDPADGRLAAQLGGSSCQPASSLPTAAGLACFTSSLAIGRIDWSGGSVIFANGDAFTGGESLSPDGTQLLASGGGALLKLIDSPATGSTVRTVGQSYPQGGGYPGDGGWLDDSHAVYRRAGSPNQYVIDLRTQTDTAMPAGTVLAARLPGGY